LIPLVNQSCCIPDGTTMNFYVMFFACHSRKKHSQAQQRRRSFRKSRKVMKRLCRKSFRGEVNMAYPRLRNMFRVETPWEINNNRQRRKVVGTGAGAYRQWARDSLSRRFVSSKQRVDPQEDPPGQGGLSMRCEPPPSNGRTFQSEFSRLVGDARVRKKFVRICRGALADLGIAVVGPIPYRALEIMWEYFGEEHFSVHGRACWCRLCRSVGPARFSFVQGIGEALYDYVVSLKTIALAAFGLIAPAPLRMAKFVAGKLWKWLKILLED